MNILFITSNRLGDAVLSMGALDYMVQTYPDARITIACGGLPSTLFEAVPGLEKIIVLKKRKHHGHWIDLWKQTSGTKWDVIVDFRDSVVSRVLRSKKKRIFSKIR